MGVPVELNSGVLGNVIDIEVNDYEKELFAQSAISLQEQYQQLLS
jgi:malate/lactate dehydrogenase